MLDTKHLIRENCSVLEALKQINAISPEPLVLFAVDNDGHMVGTLTDGDVRRAMIKGAKLEDPIFKVMRRDFRFLRKGENDDVKHLREQRSLKMKLVPILDANNNFVEIINLEKYITKLPIDAVLMAGGKGIRLRPLTETTPKPLLPVGGKPIIDHNIDRLIRYGIEHVSVTVNYLREQLEEHYSAPYNGIQINCIREPRFLGTIGSIQFVPKLYNDVVLVMNSDLFTDINYEDFYLHFMENDADMSAAATPYSVSVPYGIFDLDGRNVKGIREKPTYNYFANAGIYLLKKSVLDMIPKDKVFNATDLMEMLVSNNKKVIRFPITGYWLDIGNKEEYEKANELVKHVYPHI